MPDPVAPAAPAIPNIDLEPVLITASPSKPAATPPLPVGQVALECLDEGIAAAVAVLSKDAFPHPAVAALAAAGSGFAFASCVANAAARNEEAASIHRAVTQCIESGGAPTGVVEHTLDCVVIEDN
jgi:hypothetical protein